LDEIHVNYEAKFDVLFILTIIEYNIVKED
jgi:hypothetical protein